MCPTWIGEQMAYNATKLSKIVKERDKAQNWLDYFEIKLKRNPAVRPVTKVPSYICVIICTLVWVSLGIKPSCNILYTISVHLLSRNALSDSIVQSTINDGLHAGLSIHLAGHSRILLPWATALERQ